MIKYDRDDQIYHKVLRLRNIQYFVLVCKLSFMFSSRIQSQELFFSGVGGGVVLWCNQTRTISSLFHHIIHTCKISFNCLYE